MTIGSTISAAAGLVSPETERFLRALELLFRAGRYYPVDHEKTSELTAEFHAAARRVTDGGELVFEVREGELVLQGEPVPADAPGVSGLLALLEPSAVARMTIDTEIDADHLHALVLLLPRLRQQAAGTAADGCAVFTGVPVGVTIDQREFRIAEDDELSEAWAILRDRIRKSLRALEARGLGMEQTALCRHLVRGFGARMQAALDGGEEDLEAPDLDESLIANLDLTAAPTSAGVAGVTRRLDGLVDLLEQSLSGDEARRTEEIFRRLVSLLERSVPESWHAGAAVVSRGVSGESGDFSLELPELIAQLMHAEERVATVPGNGDEDRCEHLSLLLGILPTATRPALRLRLRRELTAWLSREPSPQEMRLFREASIALLQGPCDEGRRLALSEILRVCREAPGVSPLILLEEWSRTIPSPRRLDLWPLAVNEVLQGDPDADPATMNAMQAWLLPLPEGAAGEEAWAQLVESEAVALERFDQELVRSLPETLAGFFAAYLRLKRDDVLSQLLMTTIQARPTSWLDASLTPLLEPSQPEHREIYALLLEQRREEQDLPRLHELASDLLVSRLSSLPRGRRQEGWVRGSILILGRMGGPAAVKLLETIRHQKRCLVVPAWPSGCREAARAAREQLRLRAAEVEV